jgi:hypothetical protein
MCEIIGSDGVLRFSFFKKSTIEINNSKGTTTVEAEYPENIQKPMIEAVVKYFRGTGANPCSLEEALVVMEMIDSTNQD